MRRIRIGGLSKWLSQIRWHSQGTLGPYLMHLLCCCLILLVIITTAVSFQVGRLRKRYQLSVKVMSIITTAALFQVGRLRKRYQLCQSHVHHHDSRLVSGE